VSYFAKNPEVVKIFDDLDKFRDFCRFEGEKARAYQAFLDPVKARKERREKKQARFKKRRYN
jgi:hypothetical protein